MASCYWAWNRKSKVIVRWLGSTTSKTKMTKRLRKYDAPVYVVAKKAKCTI